MVGRVSMRSSLLAAFGLLLQVAPTSAAGAGPGTFGAAGELLVTQSAADTDPAAGGRSGDFLPNVRVDDDLNPEHREPVVAWGPDGTIYAAYCERESHWNPELVMFTKSTDGGENWRAPAVQINDTAPNAVVFPAIGVMDDGTILLVWSEMKFAPFNYEIRFSRSEDGGESWSPSTVVHPLNPATSFHRPSLVVTGNRILVSYWEEVSYPDGLPVTVYSDDSGESWSLPATVTMTPGRYDGAAACLAENAERSAVGLVMASSDLSILYFQSSDGGQSWSDGVRVNQSAGASTVDCPDLACRNGRDYVVWSDNRSGQYDVDVWISQSEDGETFTPDVKVNDAFGGNQYEPHMRVDPSGKIHVCWIWNLPFQGDIDLYYTVSEDGGLSWLWPTPRVNDIPYVVEPYVAWTSDLLADSGGNAYLLWNDGRGSGYYDNIFFSTNREPAAIAEGDGAPSMGERARFRTLRGTMQVLGQPGPRPVLILQIEEPIAGARLDVVDFGGRIVRPIHSGSLAMGRHRFAVSGGGGGVKLAQGLYLVRLTTARETAVRRALLLY